MQCQLNIPKEYSVEWIATFSDDQFDKLEYKRKDNRYTVDVDENRNGILVSYGSKGESFIGAYPIQNYIRLQ